MKVTICDKCGKPIVPENAIIMNFEHENPSLTDLFSSFPATLQFHEGCAEEIAAPFLAAQKTESTQ